jgi:hypothetical protein
MTLKALIAAARGMRRQPERAAPHAPQQRDAARVSGRESSELTAEEAQGRRQLLIAAVVVWLPQVPDALGRGLSVAHVGVALLSVLLIVGLTHGLSWARTVTAALLGVGSVFAAIGIATATTWPERIAHILAVVCWGSAASTLEYSEAIDAYCERDER